MICCNFIVFYYFILFKGTKNNTRKAIEIYEKGVEMGDDCSMTNLAFIFKNGDDKEGIKMDLQKAIKLYERSVEMGNSNAMNNLAIIYQKGNEKE